MALEKPSPTMLTESLEQNLANIKRIVGQNSDFIYRQIELADGSLALVVYIDGMISKDAMSEYIIKPLSLRQLPADQSPKHWSERYLFIPDVRTVKSCEEFLHPIYSGDCGILWDGRAEGIVTDIKGFERRGVSEPRTEIVVRGSREGFVENIKTNMTMIRRRLKTPDLAFEMIPMGTETVTNVAIAYLRGQAAPELIDEVRKRLKAIQIDGILESGYIEQLVEDEPFSPFSTIANSEKPDKVCAKLLEGRVAVLVDGTPFVLTMPMLFVENFQSAEDYYSRPFFASLVRLLRFFAFLVAVFAPAVYVAIVTWHQEVMPYNLLLNIWQAEANTPFSAGASVLLITLLYEVVREAGIRLPQPVGAAISIVGGLVIGDMVVSAGLISAPVVIVVAFTAIAMFVVDSLTDAATLLRIAMVLVAWVFGLYGVLLATMLLLVHLIKLRSFGTPYFAPFAPFDRHEMRDTLLRFPLWLLGRRPGTLSYGTTWRQKEIKPPAQADKKPLER
jgi:spore germination protein KA